MSRDDDDHRNRLSPDSKGVREQRAQELLERPKDRLELEQERLPYFSRDERDRFKREVDRPLDWLADQREVESITCLILSVKITRDDGQRVRAFDPEVIKTLSNEYIGVALQLAEDLLARRQGRKTPEYVAVIDDNRLPEKWPKDADAGYYPQDRTIYFHEDLIKTRDAGLLVFKLIHEVTHVEQVRFMEWAGGQRPNDLSEKDAYRLEILQDARRSYNSDPKNEYQRLAQESNFLEVEANRLANSTRDAYDKLKDRTR